ERPAPRSSRSRGGPTLTADTGIGTRGGVGERWRDRAARRGALRGEGVADGRGDVGQVDRRSGRAPGRRAGATGGVDIFDGQAQRCQLVDDSVDVVTEAVDAALSTRDRQLDGAGDALV